MKVPEVVTLAILLVEFSVNQRLPSGPTVISAGPLLDVGTVYSVKVPEVVTLAILLEASPVLFAFSQKNKAHTLAAHKDYLTSVISQITTSEGNRSSVFRKSWRSCSHRFPSMAGWNCRIALVAVAAMCASPNWRSACRRWKHFFLPPFVVASPKQRLSAPGSASIRPSDHLRLREDVGVLDGHDTWHTESVRRSL